MFNNFLLPQKEGTNLNGGKITIKDIYPDGKYKTDTGVNIDMLYPANSLISRSISGALYEVHLNAMGVFIDNAVRENRVTPTILYNTLRLIYREIGKEEIFLKSNMGPDDWFESVKRFGMEWKIRPYDEEITVQTQDRTTAICEDVFGFRKLKLYTNDIEVSDPHVVGKMFMMR